MPTARITFGNKPIPIGVYLSRGQTVQLDFDYELTGHETGDPVSASITNLRGFIVQPSGQIVRQLTALDLGNIEANETVQGWMHERVHDLTNDDRGP